jgi:hypothetical protein
MEVTEEMRQLLRRSIKCLPYDSSPKGELNDLLVMMSPPPEHEVRTWRTRAGLFYVYCTCGDIFNGFSGMEATQLFQAHQDKKLNV